MKTKIKFSLVALLLFAIMTIVNAQIPGSSKNFKNDPSLGGDVTITKVENEVVGNECYTNFEIDVPTPGDYFIHFWLLPAKLADGSFTTYKVLVNGSVSGRIIPAEGNWQNISLSEQATVSLQQGSNVISVASVLPETPAVEFVRLSMNADRSRISSAAYDNYLSKAKNTEKGMRISEPEETDNVADYDVEKYIGKSVVAKMQIFTNVPLKYSARQHYYFYAGQEMIILSQSKTPHVLEFYEQFKTMDLSWQNVSEKSTNGTDQLATIRLTIPVDGYYIMGVRTCANGVMGTVNINVNGNYFYQDQPIYYQGRSFVIPADGNRYAVYTISDEANYSDPYLCIEGGGGTFGKVILCNDDADRYVCEHYGLLPLDSYLARRYTTPTSGIRVTTSSSSNPEKNCHIAAGVYEGPDAMLAAPGLSIDDNGSNGTTGIRAVENVELNIYPNPADASSVLSIVSNGSFTKMEIYNASGSQLLSRNVAGLSAKIPINELNMGNPGIYMIKFYGAEETITRKIIVR